MHNAPSSPVNHSCEPQAWAFAAVGGPQYSGSNNGQGEILPEQPRTPLLLPTLLAHVYSSPLLSNRRSSSTAAHSNILTGSEHDVEGTGVVLEPVDPFTEVADRQGCIDLIGGKDHILAVTADKPPLYSPHEIVNNASSSDIHGQQPIPRPSHLSRYVDPSPQPHSISQAAADPLGQLLRSILQQDIDSIALPAVVVQNKKVMVPQSCISLSPTSATLASGAGTPLYDPKRASLHNNSSCNSGRTAPFPSGVHYPIYHVNQAARSLLGCDDLADIVGRPLESLLRLYRMDASGDGRECGGPASTGLTYEHPTFSELSRSPLHHTLECGNNNSYPLGGPHDAMPLSSLFERGRELFVGIQVLSLGAVFKCFVASAHHVRTARQPPTPSPPKATFTRFNQHPLGVSPTIATPRSPAAPVSTSSVSQEDESCIIILFFYRIDAWDGDGSAMTKAQLLPSPLVASPQVFTPINGVPRPCRGTTVGAVSMSTTDGPRELVAAAATHAATQTQQESGRTPTRDFLDASQDSADGGRYPVSRLVPAEPEWQPPSTTSIRASPPRTRTVHLANETNRRWTRAQDLAASTAPESRQMRQQSRQSMQWKPLSITFPTQHSSVALYEHSSNPTNNSGFSETPVVNPATDTGNRSHRMDVNSVSQISAAGGTGALDTLHGGSPPQHHATGPKSFRNSVVMSADTQTGLTKDATTSALVVQNRANIVHTEGCATLSRKLETLSGLSSVTFSSEVPETFRTNVITLIEVVQFVIKFQRSKNAEYSDCFVCVKGMKLVVDLWPEGQVPLETSLSSTVAALQHGYTKEDELERQQITSSPLSHERSSINLPNFLNDKVAADRQLRMIGSVMHASSLHVSSATATEMHHSHAISASGGSVASLIGAPPPPPTTVASALSSSWANAQASRMPEMQELHHTPPRRRGVGTSTAATTVASIPQPPSSISRTSEAGGAISWEACAYEPLDSFLPSSTIGLLQACGGSVEVMSAAPNSARIYMPFTTEERLGLLQKMGTVNLSSQKGLSLFGVNIANALTEDAVSAAQLPPPDIIHLKYDRAAARYTTVGRKKSVLLSDPTAPPEDHIAVVENSGFMSMVEWGSDNESAPESWMSAVVEDPVNRPVQGSRGNPLEKDSSLEVQLDEIALDASLATPEDHGSVSAAVTRRRSRISVLEDPSTVLSLGGGSSEPQPHVASGMRTVTFVTSPQSGQLPLRHTVPTPAHEASPSAATARPRVEIPPSRTSAATSWITGKSDGGSARVVSLFGGYQVTKATATALGQCSTAILEDSTAPNATPCQAAEQEDFGTPPTDTAALRTDPSSDTAVAAAIPAATGGVPEDWRRQNSFANDSILDSSADLFRGKSFVEGLSHSGNLCSVDGGTTGNTWEEQHSMDSTATGSLSKYLHILVYHPEERGAMEETLGRYGHCITCVNTPQRFCSFLRAGLTGFGLVMVEWTQAAITPEIKRMLLERCSEQTILMFHITNGDAHALPIEPSMSEEAVLRSENMATAFIDCQTVEQTRAYIHRRRLMRQMVEVRLRQSYQIIRQIGSGAFGDVFEVMMFISRGRLAMKRVFLKSAALHMLEMLNREVMIMSTLDHSNIIAFSHSRLDADSYSIFMELCDGTLSQRLRTPLLTLTWAQRGDGNAQRTLGKSIHLSPCLYPSMTTSATGAVGAERRGTIDSSSPTLSAREAVLIIHDMASAIAYIHSKDIIHRDLKPENVLFANGVAKLADFGSAARVNERRPLTNMKGTFSYMSPEVLLGEPYGKPCDLWSLGCILAEIMGLNLGHLNGLHIPALISFYEWIPLTESLPVTVTNNRSNSTCANHYATSTTESVLHAMQLATHTAARERSMLAASGCSNTNGSFLGTYDRTSSSPAATIMVAGPSSSHERPPLPALSVPNSTQSESQLFTGTLHDLPAPLSLDSAESNRCRLSNTSSQKPPSNAIRMAPHPNPSGAGGRGLLPTESASNSPARAVTCISIDSLPAHTTTATLPSSLIDLFESLFHRDPTKRMTIEEFLEHPVSWNVEWVAAMLEATHKLSEGLAANQSKDNYAAPDLSSNKNDSKAKMENGRVKQPSSPRLSLSLQSSVSDTDPAPDPAGQPDSNAVDLSLNSNE